MAATQTKAVRVGAHTPGPWTVVNERGSVHVNGGGGTVVMPDAIGWLPDATLIAAAPDLLDALRELAGVTERALSGDYDEDDTVDALKDAREAIARATEA